MLERLSEKFAGKLIQAGIISEEDTDVYTYGFFQAVMMLFNIVTTLILGIVFQLLIPCILLNLAYIPLRTSAGGHHADSPLKCCINSTVMIAVLLAVIKWIPIHPIVSIALLAISIAIIFILAPVETENNPLDEAERRVFKKRTRIVLCIEIAVFAALLIFYKSQIAGTIALGTFTEGLMILAGFFKNKQH